METIASLIQEFDKALTNPNKHAVKVRSSPMSHADLMAYCVAVAAILS